MLTRVGDDIWTVEGPAVPFYGMPYSTRMTVVRLADGALWLHSPVPVSEPLRRELAALGEVQYLIAPNKLHHLFIQQWLLAFPDARAYAPPGLEAKRPDIAFAKQLTTQPEPAWSTDIDQSLFTGSALMQEMVFFHKPSKTLIVADLIENFEPQSLNTWQRVLARLAGILAPNGKTPIDWRLSFIFGKREARHSLATLLAWEPENIILAHGECVFGDAQAFLRKSFAWV
nr:DUF4336 domain-containing protein [uncultured Pseudomonas sp.]